MQLSKPFKFNDKMLTASLKLTVRVIVTALKQQSTAHQAVYHIAFDKSEKQGGAVN